MQASNSTSPFLQRVRNAIRVRHYSIRTEQAYVDWIRRFILFHGKRHPNELGEADVGRFLTWLAVERNVAPSTQNQALNALVFLYRHVIDRPLGDITNAARAKKPQRLPVVLTQDETKRLFRHLDGNQWLPVCLLYGSGLRLVVALRLRVKDVGFERLEVTLRDVYGGKERRPMLPQSLVAPLQQQLARVRTFHEQDRRNGWMACIDRTHSGDNILAGLAVRTAGLDAMRSA